MSDETFEQRLAANRAQFAPYTLTEHGASPCRVFQLRKPGGGRAQGVELLFTGGVDVDERIVLAGDLTPHENRGVVSCLGYGLDWFAGRCSPDYLCSRFLRTTWQPSRALAALEDQVEQERKDATDANLSDLDRTKATVAAGRFAQALGAVRLSPGEVDDPTRNANAFDELWRAIYNDGPEDIGYGYDPRDAALLVATQEAFARLYWAARASGELPSYPETSAPR